MALEILRRIGIIGKERPPKLKVSNEWPKLIQPQRVLDLPITIDRIEDTKHKEGPQGRHKVKFTLSQGAETEKLDIVQFTTFVNPIDQHYTMVPNGSLSIRIPFPDNPDKYYELEYRDFWGEKGRLETIKTFDKNSKDMQIVNRLSTGFISVKENISKAINAEVSDEINWKQLLQNISAGKINTTNPFQDLFPKLVKIS